MNAVAFAYYNFASSVSDAETVTTEFDFYVSQVSGHLLISLADADYHTGANGGFTGKSNTGYGSTGTIFNLGCYRSGNDQFAINSSQNSSLTSTCLGHWCHANITVNNSTKKVSYTITDSEDNELTSGTDVNFLNASAQRCSQIDIYIGTNASGNAVQIDNLVITKTVSTTEHDYTINAVAGETVIKEYATGTVVENASYGVNVNEAILYNGHYYVLDDASNTNLNGYYASYTMSTSDAVQTINYTLDESIVYYSELEGSNYEEVRTIASGGKVNAYNQSGGLSTNLDAGVYSVDIKVYEGRNRSATSYRGLSISVAGTTVYSEQGKSAGVHSFPIKVNADNSAVRIFKGYNETDWMDYVIIRSVDLSDYIADYNALKTYASALAAVPNDNSTATSVLTSAIATQDAAVDAAASESEISAAKSTLLTAMNTFVAAANPTTGNTFNLTYLFTNPNLEDITEWALAADNGWSTDIPTSGLGDYNNFVLRTNLNSSKNAVERFTSNACSTASTFAIYQTVNLPVGNYNFTSYAFAGATTIVMAAGDTEGDAVTATDFTEYGVDFTQTSESDIKLGIKISSEGTNTCNWMAMSGLKLYKTPASSVSGTIASSGYSSLASAYGLDFSNATGLTAAYVVTNITNSAVMLTNVDELPANSGVILKGTGGASYSIPVKADATYEGTNKLHAAVTAYDCAANEVYILQSGQFHLVTAASTVPAGKAYLLASDLPTPAAARSLVFAFDNETTGINGMCSDLQNGDFYNLQGQRVDVPKKGLYIVNGKKVVIK